eukprot:4658429-Pyramimonas_sp.AAC.1
MLWKAALDVWLENFPVHGVGGLPGGRVLERPECANNEVEHADEFHSPSPFPAAIDQGWHGEPATYKSKLLGAALVVTSLH